MESNKPYQYTYTEFTKDILKFCELIKDYKPDIILAIARGGVTFGHFLSERLNIRKLYTLNSIHYDHDKKLKTLEIFNIPNLEKNKKVLVVDDIVDSGDTMKEVISILQKKFPTNSFKSGVIFYKPNAIYKPDFSLHTTDKWIDFFWSN